MENEFRVKEINANERITKIRGINATMTKKQNLLRQQKQS